ncbi:MAG: hypothetical protein HYU98_03960 [Deltaproteobacteria bacterium]|nr:hypothetical protein [Deltaproteobacteria bacterium]
MGDRNTNIIRGRETINMPEMVLEGGPAYTHVVLELPGFLAFDQLPVVMLFLSQLNDAAKKEAKPFLLTVHLLSDGTPVKNQLLTDETMTEIVKALTDAYFKRLEGGDEYILKEPEKEHQKLVEEKYKKELEGIATLEATLMQSVAEGELANGTYVDRRMLVRFIPDSMSFFKEPKSNVVTTFPRFHGDNAVTDIVTAGFSLLNDTYPLKLSPESNSASGFMKNFTDLTPCEAHQRLAGLFGGYFADLGRMPTNRLFESRPIADSFIFRNALRSVMEKGVYASDCSAEAAFETAANYYFNLPEEVFEKVTRGYGYRNYYTSLIAEGLLLFVGRKFHLPAKEDVIGSTSGYYEFLAEQSKTDKKAASYFLHDIINLYFRYEELREVHKGEPSFQGVVSEYLERMRATPLNFFEALYGVGGIDQDSWGEFDERPDKGKTMVWKNPWKFRDDVNSFRTLVTNFTRLPPEEKEREIDGIIKLLGAGYDNNVLDRDYNEVFLLAVDLVIEAIGTDEKLADKFARAVLSTVIFLKEDELRKDTLYPARVAEYLSQKWFPQFDSDRYLMTSDMAARLVEWTVSLKRLGENDRIPVFTKSICRIWNIAAGIISEEDRKKIQAPLTETVKNIVIDWARESINGKEKYKNYYKNPNDELDPVIFGDIKFSNYNGGYNWHEVVAWSASKLLNPDNIGKVLIGLTEAVPEIMEKQSDYLEPMLIFIFDACGETKSRMVIRYIMAKMPDCWRLVPLILKCASGFDDKKAVLIAIHEGLSAREDFWTFVRRIFNNETKCQPQRLAGRAFSRIGE